MRVLITGAAGFVGGHLYRGLRDLGFETIGAARGARPSAAHELHFAELSAGDAVKQLLDRTRPDAIIHCAAAANAGFCEANPEAARADNVAAVENLCRETRPAALPLIHFSTDLVFDGCGDAPAGGFREDDKPQPATVYARTKLSAEQIVLNHPAGLVLRSALVYGPPCGEASGMMGWLLGALKQERPVELFTDEWRTPISTGDIVRTAAGLLSSNYMKQGRPEERILNLAGSQRLSRFEFGMIAADIFGLSTKLVRAGLRSEFIKQNRDLPHRPRDVSLNVERLVDRLKFTPSSVSQGLQRMKEAGGQAV